MKKILSIFATTGILFIFSGCTEWLDIRPESEIVLEDYWQNESQVNQVLATCYRSLTEADVIRRMMVWGELRSDNVTYGSDIPEELNKILNVDISPANGYCRWNAFYTVINYCNNFLYYAPGVVDVDPNFNESKLRSLEAEVLTIRALTYFYLVRTFKEVPWIGEPSVDDAQVYNIPKSSEDSILNNLVKDLKTALPYARDNFDKTEYNKGRITRNAVRALLADIYLWQEEYGKCVEICAQILNNTEQQLQLVNGEDVVREVFYYGNSTESIFELQFDDDLMVNNAVKEFYGSGEDIFGAWSFPSILVNGDASPFNYLTAAGKESEEDLREKDFLFNYIDKYYVFKYAGSERYENPKTGSNSYYYRITTPNWIVYRLSDIILMKAEALIQLESDYAEVIRLINLTYTRANPELTNGELKLETYNSKLELENLLLRERQRELMFEGKRWFDLLRLSRRANSPAPLLSYVAKKFSGNASLQLSKMSVMDALYMPIHTDELKANSALEQNPFYELESEKN